MKSDDFDAAHGGGYMLGNLDSEDPLCRIVAEHTKSVIVNIDYRLTPEHKWPKQLEDCLTVYKWVCYQRASLRGTPIP